MARLGLNWTVGLPSGWGSYGLNLALELARKGRTPVLLDVAQRFELTPLQHALLRPHLDAYKVSRQTLRDNPGRPLAFPVLQPLSDRLEPPARIDAHPGRPDIGVVFLEHDDIPAAHVERLRGWPLVVAGSTWNAEVLHRAGLGNVVFCPQGVDRALFHPAPRRDLFPGRFLIFSGGKFEYRKGQDIVAAAFRVFRQRHADAMLVCAWANLWPASVATMAESRLVDGLPASDGGRLAAAAWLAANGVPAEAVIDVGLVRNSVMPQVLRECDLAVFPNRCEGGTNLVAMEAMACGVPTVLSANTGHLDLIGPHVAVLRRQGAVAGAGRGDWGESDVEELLEAMEQAYRQRTGGGAAAEFMAGWSWSLQTDRLLQAVDAAVAGGPAASRPRAGVPASRPRAGHAWAGLLHRAGRPAAARAAYDMVLAAAPDDVPVRNDLASLLNSLGETAAAEAHYRHILARHPGADIPATNLARLLLRRGAFEEAVPLLRTALAARPDSEDLHWRLAQALLTLGRYAEAGPHLERRHADFGLRQPDGKPRWDGRPVAGFRLLVLDEQGAGDTVQFARYLPLIPKGDGGEVVFAGKPSVLPLLRGLPGLDHVLDWTAVLPRSQCWVPLMSLPFLLGTDSPAQVPPPGGWLAVAPERAARWRDTVRGAAAVVVGLCWRGNPDFHGDALRSPGLAPLRPLFEVPGIRFVSLQVGPGRAEMASLGLQERLCDIGGAIEQAGADWRDTAAAAAACDLVISSCTSLAHVAGTVGVPTWLMLSARPDWRWGMDGESTPWYPAMRLFRQNHPGDWEALCRRMAAQLPPAG